MVNDNSQIKETNNKEKGYQVEYLQENPETQIAAVKEIEVFRIIAQNYFLEDLDEEMEIVSWNPNAENRWEEDIDSNIEYDFQEYEWEENYERERYLQDLLTELAIEAELEITWSTVNRYQNEYIQNTGPEDEVQPMELDEVYLINIPQWGELTTGLEFEETNEYHENVVAYFGLDPSWHEADYSDFFPGIPGLNFDSEYWSQPMDTYIDWEYYASQ
ncbi:20812_t:CDS:1 [Dentiscutata erythropus]|uniref:20812_t:CDS:1 n=1 Tax=Dentiscutata erythropus TaxID=1348616 RepID=A0A9N9NEY0_9GLOM|nr:20812_t:CDS:1 [Dentiscutata erythropus]